jgi:hypothetical protein
MSTETVSFMFLECQVLLNWIQTDFFESIFFSFEVYLPRQKLLACEIVSVFTAPIDATKFARGVVQTFWTLFQIL